TLLGLGVLRFGFDIPPWHIAITLMSALAGQWLAVRMGPPASGAMHGLSVRGTGPFEWRSALISGLSLCLLLRTRQPLGLAVAGLVAVGSKFALRVRRANGGGAKHLLTPTNGAIVLLLLAGAPVWVSPAQWGHHLPLAFGVAGFGSLVVHRSAR